MTSQAEAVTANLGIALPPDQSHNLPWGEDVRKLTKAIQTIDAQAVSGMQQSTWNYAVDTGSANAYAVALAPAPVLQAGLSFQFKAVHANTGASTLAVNGGSAKAITKSGTTALAGAEISAGQIVHVTYDGTQFQLISQ